ncbi:conserved hypothetical protein [Candidatus Koribacter versatilis Ellin345]|uniref:CHAT domain-containing protein n=1 Tax=Koribacter versatilis (strain Ellin345) TaxID=204669 RepID=Q1IV03_KORVE|nr:CHAT domain-containing protein [Candidatus Koribacter versatilis]ABF39297.1 conserved hypothetical protein [Candidatus Koribacter versatilis Ellin345]
MLLGFLRRLVFIGLFVPVIAAAQPDAAGCDLAFDPKTKPNLTFSDPNNADVSALLTTGYVDPAKNADAFTSALALAKEKQDKCGEALAEYGIAAATDRAKNADIQQHLKNAVDRFAEIGATHALAQSRYMLAQSLRRSSKPEEAAALAMQSSKDFAATGNQGRALEVQVSAILMNQASPPEAEIKALIDQAHALHLPGSESAILHLWGDNDFQAGHFADAFAHYEGARKILKECGCDNQVLGTLLVSMGRLERMQGQPKIALKHYDEALRIQNAIGDHEYAIQTMNAIAVAYEAMEEHPKALAQYEKALAQAKAIGAEQFIPFLEGNIGGELLRLKQYDRAAKQLQMVIAKKPSEYQLCFRENQLAGAFFHLGRKEEAYDAAEAAVNVCRKNKNQDNLADALETRAGVATEKQGYEHALADIREAMAIREEIRSHLVPDDARKQGYNERIQDLYDVSIEVLTKMDRQREALETAEKGRARAFLDLMGTQQAGDSHEVKNVVINDPSFASYVSAAPFSTQQMVEAAKRYKSTIVSYWATNDALYIWIVSQNDDVHEVRVPVERKRLAALVARTLKNEPVKEKAEVPVQSAAARGAKEVGTEAQGSSAWRTLYKLLVTPVERYLPREQGALLTIIPHHELFRLSFAALTDAKGQYLLERYALHTVPASALLQYTRENEQRAEKQTQHYLLVANASGVKLSNGVTLPELPATLREVKAIEKLLPPDAVTAFANAGSSDAAVNDALRGATVVHFATHAVLDDADPRQSFLLLYPSATTHEPTRLTSGDIYKLKLHTKLVVLSACRTGLGKITGDGIDGFSRAFFYAGTASFVATLWDVADEPTSALLPHFYRELNAGRTRAVALRNAQLAVMRDLRAGKLKAKTALGPVTLPESPLLWAAFSLSGEP